MNTWMLVAIIAAIGSASSGIMMSRIKMSRYNALSGLSVGLGLANVMIFMTSMYLAN